MKTSTNCTRPQYVCSNEKIKLMGSIDGYFPDYGHHVENEMGGLWLFPVKLLDGFWMKFTDHTSNAPGCYMKADTFENYPHKNVFSYSGGLGNTTITSKRIQMAPEGIKGILVKYVFTNCGNKPSEFTTEFIARIDMQPVWLSNEVNVFDGETDEIAYKENANCFLAKDSDNSWYTVIGCDTAWDSSKTGDYFGPENTAGNGVSCILTHRFILDAGKTNTITFYFAGSEISEDDAMYHYSLLCEDKDFEGEKERKYQEIQNRSNLTVEDESFNTIYNWAKVNTDWLVLDQEIHGRGIVAGLPEYPWWFGCDSFYTLQGILCIGNAELCKDTLKLIKDYSQKINGNGRIVHEILPNGYCPNQGNTQETAHFVTMVWKYFEWTADEDMLKECLPYIKKSIAWLQEQDEDCDLYPSGYGIIEIADLNMEMIDTAVYTCEAYECYAKMLMLTNDHVQAKRFFSLYDAMKSKINEELWDDEAGLYCDAHTSYTVLNSKREMLDIMLESSQSEEIKAHMLKQLNERKIDGTRERGWLLNCNWVINTPMEVGIAEEHKALRALTKMENSDFVGKYGMYLDALRQNHTMTISTGVMAVAQAMYGRSDEALKLIEKMFLTFGMACPGAMSEMSPDYGCFVQAWTSYSVFLPIVKFFFGINPKASESKIVISPCFPSKWKNAALDNVKILDGSVSVAVQQNNKIVNLTVKNFTSFPVYIELHKNYVMTEEQFNICAPGENLTITYNSK